MKKQDPKMTRLFKINLSVLKYSFLKKPDHNITNPESANFFGESSLTPVIKGSVNGNVSDASLSAEIQLSVVQVNA